MTAKRIGLWAGLVFGVGLQLFPVPDGLSPEGWRVASLMLLMAIWWATEAIPIPVTSLLPLVVLPLIGAATRNEATAGYASHVVLLLLGGFVVALGIERWNLHKRIALNVVSIVGDRPHALVAGFMIATAILSMWISNTATTLMMVPIALSVAAATGEEEGAFAISLLLGVCYAASIGGAATPVGTPTNLIAINWLEVNTGTTIGFAQWMQFGIPAVILLIPLTWFLVTRGVTAHDQSDAAADEITRQRMALGPMTAPEMRVALVFAFVAVLWIFRLPLQSFAANVPGLDWLSGLSDMGIAIAGAIAMFLVPSGKGGALLTWPEAVKLPWGVLLLFGGGISLGQAVTRTGLSEWLGTLLGVLGGAPTLLIIAVVVMLVIFLTELTSNVATMTTLAPVFGALAIAVGAEPSSLLAPAAVAASCAFMLPVATAPNAIIYATEKLPITTMMSRGFWINLGGVFLITLIGAYIAPIALGS